MKIVKWINKNIEEAILILLLMLMTVVMGSQVCARYVFNYSMSWTEELTRYLFVWSGFLSIGFSVQKSIAIRLEQLTEKMNAKMKAMVLIADDLIELFFFGVMIPTAWDSMREVFEAGRLSTAMGMPMWILHAAPLIGFLTVEIRLIQKLCRECRNLKEG